MFPFKRSSTQLKFSTVLFQVFSTHASQLQTKQARSGLRCDAYRPKTRLCSKSPHEAANEFQSSRPESYLSTLCCCAVSKQELLLRGYLKKLRYANKLANAWAAWRACVCVCVLTEFIYGSVSWRCICAKISARLLAVCECVYVRVEGFLRGAWGNTLNAVCISVCGNLFVLLRAFRLCGGVRRWLRAGGWCRLVLLSGGR